MASKAHKRRIRRRIKKISVFLSILILIGALGIVACDYFDIIDLPIGTEETTAEPGINIPPSGDEEISVHMIDVGQGDAILIKTSGGNMLIDSGDLGSEPREQLRSYLEAQNVTSFEYVVFTHPDADHIGSGDYVIENYEVKTVIMPDYAATTKVYARLVEAIDKKNVDLILIGEDTEVCEQVGYSFKLGPVTNTVLGPTEDFKDPNEMSVVIKAEYGETSILLTGDAEKESEAAMVEMYKKGELDCDILKVGHHGSSTSSSQAFLDLVTPESALISCGEDNKYGHPHVGAMNRLEDADVKIYRTDIDGSVVVRTNGITYTIEKEK